MPSSIPHEEYYRWEDASGRVHITSTLESVPPAERGRVERLVLERQPAQPLSTPSSTSLSTQNAIVLVACVAALLLAWRFTPRGWRWLPNLGAFALLASALAALYFGALRRTTVDESSVVASPSAIIQDAERAVEKMRQRQSERDAELERIRAEPK